jgi:hypothetical protein
MARDHPALVAANSCGIRVPVPIKSLCVRSLTTIYLPARAPAVLEAAHAASMLMLRACAVLCPMLCPCPDHYIPVFEADVACPCLCCATPLQVALDMSKLKEFTGRDKPTVIT